jgi:hypothetical protein
MGSLCRKMMISVEKPMVGFLPEIQIEVKVLDGLTVT